MSESKFWSSHKGYVLRWCSFFPLGLLFILCITIPYSAIYGHDIYSRALAEIVSYVFSILIACNHIAPKRVKATYIYCSIWIVVFISIIAYYMFIVEIPISLFQYYISPLVCLIASIVRMITVGDKKACDVKSDIDTTSTEKKQ